MEEVRELKDTDLEEKVRLYCGVAKVNEAVLSLSELLDLLPDHRTEKELESAIRSNQRLDSDYEVSSGYIVERSDVPASQQLLRSAEGHPFSDGVCG